MDAPYERLLMKIYSAAFICSILVAACAPDPVISLAGETPTCAEQVVRTGTNIPQKKACVVMTDEERQRAQQATMELRDDQMRSRMPRPGAGGG